ncbi:extracellular solute-binding protein [Candidatus Uhrbacteria bacterium]|nr:extracellular solute-binding protein [Candidatus Uhrbacteria bacterium]
MLFRRLSAILIASSLLFAGFGCSNTSNPELAAKSKPFTLKYWRVFDEDDAFNEIFAAYRAQHKNISVEYRKFRPEEYEKALLNAFAEGTGPDVFSLHNTSLGGWDQRLTPAPAVLTVPYSEMSTGLKKEVITVLKKIPGMTPQRLAAEFVPAVAEDVVIPTEQADPQAPLVPRVYGLPLAVDTMVVYYNRDLLNAAGIAQPAADWIEFREQVKKITKLDETGAIIQSGAALGTSKNVERSTDLLGLLMMQNGAHMTENGVAAFERRPPELPQRTLPPGAEALVFYTDFANPEKEGYSWNDKMPNSLEAFLNGSTAYFFGYAYHLPTIRTRAPRLNFGIAPMPQVDINNAKNFANYWVETVSKQTAHPEEAWDFVQFVTGANQAKNYLKRTKKPTALLSLVSEQANDLDLATFAAALPTAKNWYHGGDASATEKAFAEMIDAMLAAEADPKRIVEIGVTKVNQTMR